MPVTKINYRGKNGKVAVLVDSNGNLSCGYGSFMVMACFVNLDRFRGLSELKLKVRPAHPYI